MLNWNFDRFYKDIIAQRPTPLPQLVVVLFILLISSFFSYFILTRLGLFTLVLVSGGIILLAVLAYFSLKDLSFALVLWMLSMCGFRTLGLVSMPGLPDFSFDRLLLMWIILMFIFQIITGRARFKGPYVADVIIVLHTAYILVQIQVIESEHFHNWVISNLSPLFAYLYGKYTINRDKELRNIFIFFLCMTIYFYVMSIAQQLNWEEIIWPKTILDRNVGLWHRGRSRGPVLHPPYFGQLLGMFLLIQLYLLVKNKITWVRILLSVSMAFSFLGLFFTYTRGPWVAT
ncbi:MAG: hypothetical protein AMJ53_17140, partial [Gammaproteobacteria bacterium SG8_11]